MSTPTAAMLTPTCQTPTTPTATIPFTSAALVAALEQAWAAIRAAHPEVPAVVLVVGSGSPVKASQRLKYGHFDGLRWQSGDDRLPEVLVSGEGLSRTPAEVFTTLLHEAVHGLADVRAIKDTSRQGRWHNKQFATLATELGMTTIKDDKLGFSPCTLTDTATVHYRASIDTLTAALHAWRHVDLPGEGNQRSNNGVSAECECPRKIRISTSVLDVGPIWCGLCYRAFLSEDVDRDVFNADNPPPVPANGDNHHDRDNHDQDDEEADDVTFYDPSGVRFGIPTYPFKAAPTGLATVRQLRALGLRPAGQQPVAQMLWRKGKRVAYLYHIALAAPKRTASLRQRDALDKALTARRTCPTCSQVKDYYIPRRHGECLDCAGGI
jgi:hypothetical protein